MRTDAASRSARLLALGAVLLVGLTQAAPAQLTPQGVPPGTDPVTGARPGNEVGTGMSLPAGNRASNIGPQDSQNAVAPNLPGPALPDNARASDYMRAAQNALAAGRSGEAQQALEMAQTRLLDRSVPLGQTNNPSDNPAVRQTTLALQALSSGDRATCMQQIQAALNSAVAQGL